MSEPVQIAIIVSLAPTLLALASLIASLRNGRRIEEVHKATNGKMEQLLEVTKDAAFAQGVKQEVDREK